MSREMSKTKEIKKPKETGPINIHEKLKNLKENLPNQDEVVYEFAEFLLGIIPEKGMQANFDASVEIALDYIENGIDQTTGKQIPQNLMDNQKLLSDAIPVIKKAIFAKPEEE